MEKFYWLKLRRDFFKRHDMTIIESMPNGKDYIIFYLKLLCESIDHEGCLRFNEEIPYDEQMLSVITGTNIDVVRSAINVFTKLKMMTILDDGTYFMNEVNKMIGSAVDNDNANRQRRFREKQKELALQNVTENVTKNNESKSIEIDIEKDKDIDNKNSCSNQALNESDVNEKFNKFWNEYPRKVGKDKCLRWFKQHKVTDDLLEKMLDTLKKYKNTEQWTSNYGKYIPHPFTWLNRGSWDDEVKDGGFEYTSSAIIEEFQWGEIEKVSQEELEALQKKVKERGQHNE